MAVSDRVLDVLVRSAGVSLALCAALLSPAALTAVPETPPATDVIEVLDEVVVTGRVPGPPLWRVSRDDHVLWILPLIDAYPRDIEWESARVESLIAQAEEYIERPIASWGFATSNPFTIARMLSAGKRYSKLPRGQRLADVLPADLYRRYEVLESRYFARRSDIEALRISVAGMEMQRAIMARESLQTLSYRMLASPQPITEKLRKWLKRNKGIRRTNPEYRKVQSIGFGELGELSKAIEEASTSEAYVRWELGCFEKVLAYFENDISRVKRRANDWARGRADTLVDSSPLRGMGDACNFPPLIPGDSPAMAKLRQETPDLAAQLGPMFTGDRDIGESISRQRWLEAAELAMARNKVTFSVLAVEDVISEGGLVSQLKEKGYEVSISAE